MKNRYESGTTHSEHKYRQILRLLRQCRTWIAEPFEGEMILLIARLCFRRLLHIGYCIVRHL